MSIPSSTRRAFSLSSRVKKLFPAGDREALCEKLALYWSEGHARWPGNDLEVKVAGTVLFLSADLLNPNKVKVR